jgi:hypothetical protein
LTPDRWHQLTAIFHAALARDAASRDQFVADGVRNRSVDVIAGAAAFIPNQMQSGR